MLLRRSLDDRSLRLLSGRARKVLLWPDQPAPHLLVLGKMMIGALDDCLRIWWRRVRRLRWSSRRIGGIAQDQHGASLGIAALFQTDHHAVADLGLLPQRSLQVLGIDVHPFARDDDIFLATLEVEIAFGIELADIAGAKPAFFVQHRLELFCLPIAGSNVGAAHQDFAVLIELDFAAFQHFADRTLAGAKRMVQRNERSGFGEAVALNHDEAKPPPEFFGLGIKRRAAGDEGPELPAELVMDSAESPPALHKVLVFRGCELPLEPVTAFPPLPYRARFCLSATPSAAERRRPPKRAPS